MLVLVLVLGLLIGVASADIQCDGVDDLLTSGQPLSAFVNASAFTVTLYLNSTGSTFANTACWAAGSAVADFQGNVVLGRAGPNGDACAYLYDGTDRPLTWPVSAGWHHLALRFDAGTMTFFTDGTTRGTLSGIGTLDLSGSLSVCGIPTVSASPDRLTDVQLFNTALSDAAIARMAHSRLRGHTQTAPTAYWPLDDCPDGTAGVPPVSFRDRSGNNRHLTGNDGGTGGLTCRATSLLMRPWGIQ